MKDALTHIQTCMQEEEAGTTTTTTTTAGTTRSMATVGMTTSLDQNSNSKLGRSCLIITLSKDQTKFLSSSNRKQRIGAYGSRKLCTYVKRISKVSREFPLVRILRLHSYYGIVVHALYINKIIVILLPSLHKYIKNDIGAKKP